MTNHMHFSRARQALVTVSFLAALAAPLEAAPLEQSVIGSSGEVFRVVAGLYGELFPGGQIADPAFPVLALDVDESDGTAARLLVPGSENDERESNPALVYDEVAQVVHLVWETQINHIHPVLRLVSYGTGTWSEPHEIIGDPFAAKTHPVLFVTHDSTRAEETGSGPEAVRRRTILHVVWAQQKAEGFFETLYSPIMLRDGDPIYDPPVIGLDDIADLTVTVGANIDPATDGLTHLRAGEDGRTVVVAFPSVRTGRIAAVKLDVLPVELARLGEGARAHIIDAGFDGGSNGLRKIADGARAHIIDAGVRLGFHLEVVRSIADAARAHIIDAGASGESDIRRIADGARAHIIDAGVKFSDRGLRRLAATGFTSSRLVEISPPNGIENEHMVRVGLASSLPAPQDVGPSPRLFSSPSGTNFIISWRDGEQIAYRESRDEYDWSEVRVIRLSEALSASDAYAALERRVSSF